MVGWLATQYQRVAANDGPGVMRNYTSQHLAGLKLGSVGHKHALLDVSRFLRFAVKKCGAEASYLPLQKDPLEPSERSFD